MFCGDFGKSAKVTCEESEGVKGVGSERKLVRVCEYEREREAETDTERERVS